MGFRTHDPVRARATLSAATVWDGKESAVVKTDQEDDDGMPAFDLWEGPPKAKALTAVKAAETGEDLSWDKPETSPSPVKHIQMLFDRLGKDARTWTQGLLNEMEIPADQVDSDSRAGVAMMTSFLSGFLHQKPYDIALDENVRAWYSRTEIRETSSKRMKSQCDDTRASEVEPPWRGRSGQTPK